VTANELYQQLGEILKRNRAVGSNEVQLAFETWREDVDSIGRLYVTVEGVAQDKHSLVITLTDSDL